MEYEIKSNGLTGRVEACEYDGVFVISVNTKKKIHKSEKNIKTTYFHIKANKKGEVTSFYGDKHTYQGNDPVSTTQISIEQFDNSPEFSNLRKNVYRLLSYISQEKALPKNTSNLSKAF